MNRAELLAAFGDDQDYVDGQELVDLLYRRPGGADECEAAGVPAVWFARDLSDAPAGEGGTLFTVGRTWHLKANGLQTAPRPRDRLRDASGAVWIIESVRLQTMESCYHCESVRQP